MTRLWSDWGFLGPRRIQDSHSRCGQFCQRGALISSQHSLLLAPAQSSFVRDSSPFLEGALPVRTLRIDACPWTQSLFPAIAPWPSMLIVLCHYLRGNAPSFSRGKALNIDDRLVYIRQKSIILFSPSYIIWLLPPSLFSLCYERERGAKG